MSDSALTAEVLAANRFGSLLRAVSMRSILRDLSAVTTTLDAEEPDWDYGLFAASIVARAPKEPAQAAALHIAHGCLTDPATQRHHRDAATVILERMGNRPAVALAERRELISPQAWTDFPAPLELDIIRARLTLSIPLSKGESVAANLFQREFWSAASRSTWVSVSAPTSAGKSYIVKRWFDEQLSVTDTLRCVYLVPTRALIDEVSTDLRGYFSTDARVFTLPWDVEIGMHEKEVFVVTQERLHLLQQRFADFRPTLIFIDEAQKFGDDSRGVLLQRVLDESVRRVSSAQVLFASALSRNPEVLLDGAPDPDSAVAFTSEMLTVNQNLMWANQIARHPRRWTLDLVSDVALDRLGEFEIPARPAPVSKRLPLVAVALGRDAPGNIVYVNGAAAAEKAALQIHDALGSAADLAENESISALRELVGKTIHPQYALVTALARGVAFHYGNMPLLVRAEIERLFRAGTIKFLVCTSTLLEGVNLPCRNLFARGPKKGNKKVMSVADFWNLAGRAGRWGQEFQGNIICIDTSNERLWPDPPRSRVRQPINRASDEVVSETDRLLSYIESGTPIEESRAWPAMEAVFSLLAARRSDGVDLEAITGLALQGEDAERLQEAVDAALETIRIPTSLLAKHAGISPVAMQRLLDYFESHKDPDKLPLAVPESHDAVEAYVRALSRVMQYLGGNFGVAGRQWVLAMLIANWMRGYPLARLIAERVSYFERRGEGFNVAVVIRSTMDDVEQIARFEAPKYLACYQDVLAAYLTDTDRVDLVAEMPDIEMMLELGVSRKTEVSLMALGLSRTSAVALSEFIVEDDLAPGDGMQWIEDHDLASLDMPVLVRTEIERVRDEHRPAA